MILIGKKRKFLELLLLLNKVPTSKIAAETHKYVSFRRNLRKSLNDYIEAEQIINKKHEVKFETLRNEILSLQEKVSTLKTKKELIEKDNEKLTGLERQLEGYNMQFGLVNLDKSKEIKELFDLNSDQELEITFNIEDHSYIKKLFTDNAGDFFSYERDKEKYFDADTYDSIITLLESEKK